MNSFVTIEPLCYPEFDRVTIEIPCSTMNSSSSAIIADINGDNQPDLILYCYPDSALNILLGNSFNNNIFQEFISYPFDSDMTVSNILVVDMNNDSIADIILTDNIGGQSYFSVLFGNGNGTFQIENIQSTVIIDDPAYIVVSDLNMDQKLDVIIATVYGNIYVFWGNNNGIFLSSLTLNIGYKCYLNGLIVNDFNSDNHLDIAVLTLNDLCIHIFFGSDNGSSWLHKWVFTTIDQSGFILISGDFDENNESDIIVFTVSESISSILYRYDNGSFHTDVQTFMEYYWYFGAIAVGDLNDDRHLDIATTMVNSEDLFYYLGNGNGIFAVQNLTLSQYINERIWNDIMDFNNDNCQDIINMDLDGDGGIDIFLSTCQCYT